LIQSEEAAKLQEALVASVGPDRVYKVRVDEGDMFILEFDLESETVILRLGDESLLDSLA